MKSFARRSDYCARSAFSPGLATWRRLLRTHWCWSIFLFVCCNPAASAERANDPQPTTTGAEQFTTGALLRRFDSNSNGSLDECERITLPDTFGGMDVPLLPQKPFNYTDVKLPAHVNPSELQLADNTPQENRVTNHGAALGRVLFYDKQLSSNGTVACASCHAQEAGFADIRQFSVGFEGKQTRRNAMGLANLRYSNVRGGQPGFFWDERAPTLEAQALIPIQDPVEMGMQLQQLEDKLQRLPYYPPLFEAAFGSREVTSERIARAVAQFVRSMESWNSRFDQAAARSKQRQGYSADFDDFTPQENLGKALFFDGVGGIAEFGCAHCHVPPVFAMPKSLNNGLDLNYEDQGLGELDRPSNDPFTPSNDGKFKAPSLRNIELTAPYMHDGRFTRLEEVIEHYSSGVQPHVNLGLAFEDQESETTASGFKFTGKQKRALVAFLKTLTDSEFVSDPRFSDPFIRTAGPTD